MNPKLTVLMSCYNGASWLIESIESVLNQFYRDFEFLIIDDGSNDNSWEIICRFAQQDSRIRAERKANSGLADTLNMGLKIAKGDWIARMDQDDICLPHRLARQIEYLNQHPETILLGSGFTEIDLAGKALKTHAYPTDHQKLYHNLEHGLRYFAHSSAMYRRESAVAVGLYKTRLRYADDYRLWLDLSRLGPTACLPEALMQIRKHPSQMSAGEGSRKQLIDRTIAILCHEMIKKGMPDPAMDYSEAEWEGLKRWVIVQMEYQACFRRSSAWVKARNTFVQSQSGRFIKLLRFGKSLIQSGNSLSTVREALLGQNYILPLVKAWSNRPIQTDGANYDIIFDFSSSPVGGGLRRLVAFAQYFAKSSLRTLFLVHPRALKLIEDLNVEKQAISKPVLQRFLKDDAYLANYRGGCRWYFAYGIPVYGSVGEANWLHISNVLPFTYRQCRVGISLRLKMAMLAGRFRKAAGNPAIVSAESAFSLAEYQGLCRSNATLVQSANGIEHVRTTENAKVTVPVSFAVSIGTVSYKRLDVVVALYDQLKLAQGLSRLVIIGDVKEIPSSIRGRADIVCTGTIAALEVQAWLRQAKLYISASQVENSSNAVLEAMQFCPRAVLSAIPSHREMLIPDSWTNLRTTDGDFLEVTSASLSPQSYQTWGAIIEQMITRMGFRL